MSTTTNEMNTQDLNVVRNFFTDDEWNAIESAMNDYADYGDEESDLASNIQSKLYQLFKNWFTLKGNEMRPYKDTHTTHLF